MKSKKVIDFITALVFMAMFSTLFTTDAKITTGFMIGWIFALFIYSIPVLLFRQVLIWICGAVEK